MKISIAKTAGFCFGVKRSINLVYELLGQGSKVVTLGPIIHNPQMVQELSEKGVKIVEAPCDTPEETTLVIRSHGVAKEVIDEIESNNIKYLDATCPYVKKIHKIVEIESQKGRVILIAGDEFHPEIEGIKGHCSGEVHIFKNAEELQKLTESYPHLKDSPITVVAQTTFNTVEWVKCEEILKNNFTKLSIFDTMCRATSERQREAMELAKNCDLVIIIGGKHSSNTARLNDVCKPYCKTILIETAADLPLEEIKQATHIGITAGASTPAGIIKEVLSVMSEKLNIQLDETPVKEAGEASAGNEESLSADSSTVKDFDDMSFEEALEESLKGYNTNDVVKGVVVSVAPNEVHVDVGRKHTGFIPLSELTDLPGAKPEEIVKVGDVLDLIVLKVDDQEGTILLSKRRYDAIKGWQEIVKAHEAGTNVKGIVTDIVKGGVLANTKGVRIFIPASQVSLNKSQPLEDLLKKEFEFCIIEINRGRKRAVGSIRRVDSENKKKLEEKVWENIKVGQVIKGPVKTLTSYGAFVDLGGVDGMIHLSELSWTKIRHPSEVLKVGEIVEVVVKEVDPERRRISLGYKKAEENPWEILVNKYPVDTVTRVKIVGMTPFGAFAEVIPGIDGLIHISQISDKHIEKPQDALSIGQEVDVKVIGIDLEKKRVSLSIKALLAPPEEKDEKAEGNAMELVYSTENAEKFLDTADSSDNVSVATQAPEKEEKAETALSESQNQE